MANKEQVQDVTKEMLNKKIIIETRRPDGSIRVQEDYSCCPTLTEQHTAHLSDINYLIQKYRPDELQAYINAKALHRQEILGHDFSLEPSLQAAKNEVLRLKQNFEALPEEIKNSFSNHVEFLKFIDNPANQEKMIKMGLLTLKQIKNVASDPEPNDLKLKPNEPNPVPPDEKKSKK